MQKTFFSLVAPLLLLLVFPHCSKQEGHVTGLPAAPPPVPPAAGNGRFRAVLKPQPQADVYHVHLEWQIPDTPSENWFLFRTDLARNGRIVATLASQSREFTDTEAVAGETYEYRLCTAGAPDFVIRERLEIRIPKDMLVEKQVQLSEVRGIQRLFLQAGGSIVSPTNALYIDVDAIHSESGSLSNLPLDTTAPEGAHGRKGGMIFVRANRGQGLLRLFPRGENGGRGLKGGNGAAGSPGPKGTDGHGVPGPIGPSGPWFCIPQPTHGGPGGAGANGAPGGLGGNGGDAAKALVIIKDPSLLKVEIEPRPGIEGLGGEGGEGGLGGPGGSPGTRHHPVCPEVHAGPPGPVGMRGPTGGNGTPGQLQATCMVLGTARVGDCHRFSVLEGRVY